MPRTLTRALDDGRVATVVVTDRADGDLRVDADPTDLAERRHRITPHPWTWLRQEHGADVVVVDRPGASAGSFGDALLTDVAGAALAVQTADCAPVALFGRDAVAVVHAGWRGLACGVLDEAVERLRDRGSGDIGAHLGPCIHAGCYAFGAEDLDHVADVVGPSVRALSASGGPALDLPAGVAAVLDRLGVADLTVDPRCTGCDADRWSHRVRGDTGRQALVVWIDQ